MLGRNGNIAYVRYDHQGRIVPGGPIISAKPPRVGNWQAVSNVIGTNYTGSSGSNVLRAFVRIDYFNRVVPSSLVLLTKEPGDNNSQTTWVEINAQYRGFTTTTTSTSTTSTTTTQGPVNFDLTLECYDIGLGPNNSIFASNPIGGSGQYEFTSTQSTTEQGALNSQYWTAGIDRAYAGMLNGTYWIACRDVNNHSNIIAKSIIANCKVV